MNGWFLVAGILCLILTPIHVWGGEYVFRRMGHETFPKIPNGDGKIAKQEIRFGWHGISVDFIVSGIVLIILATNTLVGTSLTALVIALYFVGYAIEIAILPVIALRTPKTLLISPQWIACLAVALLIFGGLTA